MAVSPRALPAEQPPGLVEQVLEHVTDRGPGLEHLWLRTIVMDDCHTGKDPFQIERHWQQIYRGSFRRGGYVQHRAAFLSLLVLDDCHTRAMLETSQRERETRSAVSHSGHCALSLSQLLRQSRDCTWPPYHHIPQHKNLRPWLVWVQRVGSAGLDIDDRPDKCRRPQPAARSDWSRKGSERVKERQRNGTEKQ